MLLRCEMKALSNEKIRKCIAGVNEVVATLDQRNMSEMEFLDAFWSAAYAAGMNIKDFCTILSDPCIHSRLFAEPIGETEGESGHIDDLNDAEKNNIWLVSRIAETKETHCFHCWSYNDIVAVGGLGFWKAFRSFNASEGYCFDVYALWCIEKSISVILGRPNSESLDKEITSICSMHK